MNDVLHWMVTKDCQSLVGESGRVIAVEPIPYAFELPAANVASLPFNKVLLFNASTIGLSSYTKDGSSKVWYRFR